MNKVPLLTPIQHRKKIPFYTEKSAAEFKADPYEYYEGMVKRQIQLHLGGFQSYNYAWREIEQWFLTHLPANFTGKILELGCSVGTLIGQIAEQHPQSDCYGFDFSYQLLKVADDYWCREKTVDCQDGKGFPPLSLASRQPLKNLQFGLARAEKLPFPDDFLDVIITSFLFDRLESPMQAVNEWQRVLKPGGKLLLVTPLNFQRTLHWEAFYPESRFYENFNVANWTIDEQCELTVREPLDIRGNVVEWKCIAAYFTNNEPR